MAQENLHKKFETICDDELEKLFLSKKTYKMRSNKRTEAFLYKFAILMEHVDNNDDWMASMHLVIAPQSACGKCLDSVREMTGRENVTYQDMLEHGGGSVRLAKTKCGLETEAAYIMCEIYSKRIKDILTDLFNILAFETNYTTGWEIIRSCLYGENMYHLPNERKMVEKTQKAYTLESDVFYTQRFTSLNALVEWIEGVIFDKDRDLFFYINDNEGKNYYHLSVGDLQMFLDEYRYNKELPNMYVEDSVCGDKIVHCFALSVTEERQ